MDTKTNYTAVGGFVILLTTAMILVIIWLSSGFSFAQYNIYLVYMKESVSGLSVDAPVEYNGVNVGTVQDIELSHENPRLVELFLKIKKDTPITNGTFATLNTRGLTGITYLILQDKSTDLRQLKPAHGQAYPVIRTAPSLFLRIDTALTKLTDNTQKVSDSIQSVLDDENRKYFKEMLKSLRDIAQNFAKHDQAISLLLTRLNTAGEQAAPLLISSQRVFNSFEQQTLPLVNQLLSQANNISLQLNEILGKAKEHPSVLIRDEVQTKLGPGES